MQKMDDGSFLKRSSARGTRDSRPDCTSDSSRGRIAVFAAGAIGIALLVFMYLALTWGSFEGVRNVIPPFTELFTDFVMYYYPMGKAVFQTALPISGFLYSPFIAILLAVFPPLGLSASLVMWGILQMFFVVIYLLLFRWLVPAGLRIQLLFAALALSSYPLVLNLLGGQVSVFMIVGILGMLLLHDRGFKAAGAGLLAFAASFKFYPILFIAPVAARRDTRFVLYAAAAFGTVFVAVPGIFLGFGETWSFYRALLDSFRDSAWVTTNPHSQFFPHVVLRLAGKTGTEATSILPLLYGISYAVASVNMGLIYLIQRARLRYADLWSFQLVFLTIPFLLKTSWPHDFVFLPFTQALLVWWLRKGKTAASEADIAVNRSEGRTLSRQHKFTRIRITVTFLLLSILLSNIVFFNIFGNFTSFGFCAFLFWANLLLLIALYVQLLPPALRRVNMTAAQPDSFNIFLT